MIENPSLHYGHLEADKYVQLRMDICARLLSPQIRSGFNILEIGCYTANLLDYLPKDINYYGIDYDDEALEIAKRKGTKVTKLHIDSDEIQFDDIDKFDVIICTEVLEHLMNPHRIMKKIQELIKDDGWILISLPNENTLYHRLMSVSGKGVDMYAFDFYKHVHLPTIKQSQDFVSKYFKIIEKEYYIINPSAKGSRYEWLGKFLTLIPDVFWQKFSQILPGMFARGVIFLCQYKKETK